MNPNTQIPITEEDKNGQKRFFSLAGFALALSLVLTAAAELAVDYFMPDYAGSWLVQILLSCFMFLVALPLGYVILRRTSAPVIPEGQKGGFFLFLILLAVASELALMGYYIGSGIDYLRYGEDYLETSTDYSMTVYELLLYVVLALVIEPVCEELFFRRALCGRLTVYGQGMAIFFSALFYALFHCSFSNFFYAFNLGLVLGYAYLRTGKIKYPIFIHACFKLVFSAAPVAVYSKLASVDEIDALTLKVSELATAGQEGMLEFYQYCFENPRLFLGYFILAFLSVLSTGLSVFGCIMLFLRLRNVKLKPGKTKLRLSSLGDTVFMAAGVVIFILLSVVLASISYFN